MTARPGLSGKPLPAEHALEARGLSKRYRRKKLALDDVDLQIPWGQITALVGPNAAGKSTLLKTWVGFERPSGGGVRVAGLDPAEHRSAALGWIGFVAQEQTLYRDLSVADHFALAEHYRPAFQRAMAFDYLARLGIDPTSRIAELSGGQAAQATLAITLAAQARILLLDEPLASLDPLARRDFLSLLRDAVDRHGVTAVLSSHSVADIELSCDRIVVLGVGHKLLDDELTRALATHGLAAPGQPAHAEIVAKVAGIGGSAFTLVRRGERDSADGIPPASLEQIVLGYLAAARAPAGGQQH